MPANVSPERKRILRAYGASVEWTDPDKGSDGAILRARELAGNDPDYFCYMDQYSNDANWLAHYRTTGPEIWQQTAGRVTHFVAGLGTTRHLHGRRRGGSRSSIPRFRPSACSPTRRSTAWKGSSISARRWFRRSTIPRLADRELEVETEAAYDMARRLARDEGLLVGISAAAAVQPACRLRAKRPRPDASAVIVTVLPDSADKYLSERFWEEE